MKKYLIILFLAILVLTLCNSCKDETKRVTTPATEKIDIKEIIDSIKEGDGRDQVIKKIGNPDYTDETEGNINKTIIDHYDFEELGYGYIFIYGGSTEPYKLLSKRASCPPPIEDK